MIEKVGTVSIFVTDQAQAKAFYTEKLGMEVHIDAPLYPGADVKWLEVAPPGAETAITLYVPDDNWAHYKQVVGQSQSLTLTCTELVAFAEVLRSRGVNIVQEPATEPWGTYMIIADPEGNRLILTQPAAQLYD